MSVATGGLQGTQAKRADDLAQAMRERGIHDVSTALVLGSGLGSFAELLANATSISFEEIEGMPRSKVPGHAGRFVVGELAGARVLVQQGRVHLYEGHDAFTVSLAVRAFARLGVRNLVLTNAAGGLVKDWPVPCLMRIRDHLNLQHCSPLVHSESGRAEVYDAELARMLDQAAAETGLDLREGVYVGLLGPTYETPAEVRLLQAYGAHAVGMSTVAEALAAHAEGMRVAAVSCISNPGAGIVKGRLKHEDVVAAGRQISADFGELLQEFVRRIHAS